MSARELASTPIPDRLGIFRKQERHMAFAFGPHVCIGQHLARLEMERAVNALLDRFPTLRLDPDQPPPRVGAGPELTRALRTACAL